MGNLFNAMVTKYNFFGGHYSPMGGAVGWLGLCYISGIARCLNPQKNFEIQQSAPLSSADIQALLSIDPDNLGGKGNTKV